MANKTIKVRPLVELANRIIVNNLGEGDENKGFREGAIIMVERIMHDSGNYNGFRYLDADGNTYLGPFPADHDGTRRAYYLPREG